MANVRMKGRSAAVSCVLVALALANTAMAQPSRAAAVRQVVVFKAGDLGFACFRIPVLLSVPDALLAFVEARAGSCSDYHAHSILVKRSADNGATWSEATVVSNVTRPETLKDGDGLNLGVALHQPAVNETVTEKIWISWVECFHRCTVPYQYVQSSSDLGLTWDQPRDITQGILALSKFAPGPGYGLYVAFSNRLVICGHYSRTVNGVNTNTTKAWQDDSFEEMPVTSDVSEAGSACIYSDDNGATWKSGVPVPYNSSYMTPDECQPVTVGGYGELLMSMRDEHGSDHPLWSRSWDGGESWDDAYEQSNLTSATCDTSMVAVNVTGKMSLFYSHPASSRRENMQVHWSADDTGAKWTLLETLWQGPAGYSCIAAVQPHVVGVLYENGERATYERITFASVEYRPPPPE